VEGDKTDSYHVTYRTSQPTDRAHSAQPRACTPARAHTRARLDAPLFHIARPCALFSGQHRDPATPVAPAVHRINIGPDRVAAPCYLVFLDRVNGGFVFTFFTAHVLIHVCGFVFFSLPIYFRLRIYFFFNVLAALFLFFSLPSTGGFVV
jgi:hypothetical protein